MTTSKNLKDVIRTRMNVTGESYSTARRRVLEGKPMWPVLTREQIHAISMFIVEKFGSRGWKDVLSDQWANGTAEPILLALRDSHGPEWLAEFKLSAALQAKARE